MKCLFVAPGLEPVVRDMENTLEYLQDAVGGYIQTVQLAPDTTLICNEEGKLQHLLFNRFLKGKDGQPYDWIAGNFLVVGNDRKGNFTDLNKLQIEEYRRKFSLVQRWR